MLISKKNYKKNYYFNIFLNKKNTLKHCQPRQPKTSLEQV
jgi:hypothetical protein